MSDFFRMTTIGLVAVGVNLIYFIATQKRTMKKAYVTVKRK